MRRRRGARYRPRSDHTGVPPHASKGPAHLVVGIWMCPEKQASLSRNSHAVKKNFFRKNSCKILFFKLKCVCLEYKNFKASF